MLNAIKQIVVDTVEASSPVTVMFGTITKLNPLEVNVDQRFTLPADFLVLTETATLKKKEVGDRLILLRIQGGQQFVVLDKVVG